jgi:hypothetical protein
MNVESNLNGTVDLNSNSKINVNGDESNTGPNAKEELPVNFAFEFEGESLRRLERGVHYPPDSNADLIANVNLNRNGQ